MIKKICVLTATRAEYGLLSPIIKRMREDSELEVKVVVTGAHLSPEFGLTYKEIENDGIEIHKKLEILLSADSPSAISKSMGLAMISFADYFAENEFDGLMVLGDRYETLAVCCAAMNATIPIIHLHGGETTEGAIDEAVRHAITKMSYLHFTSTEVYRRRVIQLGENPDRVYNVGAMGVENALHTPLMTKEELAMDLGIDLKGPYGVLTFHPVTLETNSAEKQMRELLSALDDIKDMQFIVTRANADTEGRVINAMLEEYAAKNSNIHVYSSLGMRRYLSAVKYAKLVIGNSSSGLIEAPAFKVPTINIGDRQKGRIRAESVIDCEPECEKIISAIKEALSEGFRAGLREMENPYGDGRTSERIVEAIKKRLGNGERNLKKKFYDI